MPNRYVRASAIESESVNSLGWQAEVFWRRLLNRADDFGRLTAHPSLLRAQVFPLQNDRVSLLDIERLLAECEAAGLLFRYEYGGKPYLVMNKWEKGRAKHSDNPPPPEDLTKRMNTYVYTRKHMLAHAPDSDSDSDSVPDTDSAGADVVLVERKPEPENPQAFAKALHESYCRLTDNDARLSYQREMTWTQFVQRGFTEEDLALVVRWIKSQIARGEGGFSKQSLQFGTLMQDMDRFEDKLCTARTCKLPGVAKQDPPKPPPPGWEDYLRKTYKGCKVTTWEALTGDLKQECRRALNAAAKQPERRTADGA